MKKVLRISLVLLLLLVFLLLGGIYNEGRKTSQETPEVILVFGALVQERELSETLRLRCETALGYLNEQPKAIALLLGGQGEGEEISEALAMKNFFVKAGIQEERLLLEEQSHSTWTNLQQAKRILQKKQYHGALLACSSDYHMLRIKMLAKRLHLEVYPLAAPSPKKSLFYSYFREIFALVKSFLIDR